MDKMTIIDAGVEKSEVPRLYRRIAPRYDLWAGLTESKARVRCLEWADIQDGESVLEVAVGTGIAFREILRQNRKGRNEGVDLTEEMLNQAREKAEELGVDNYRLSVGDAYNLEYPDAGFDVVINNYMFDLLPEPDFPAVLREFHRVLRPGGRLVLVNMTKAERWYQSSWEGIFRLNPRWLGGCRGVYLLPYLESAGFKETKREFVAQMTFPSEVVFGIKE